MHCAFSLDTSNVWATASEARCACLWEVQDGRVSKNVLEGHKGIVFQVCFSVDKFFWLHVQTIGVFACGIAPRANLSVN